MRSDINQVPDSDVFDDAKELCQRMIAMTSGEHFRAFPCFLLERASIGAF